MVKEDLYYIITKYGLLKKYKYVIKQKHKDELNNIFIFNIELKEKIYMFMNNLTKRHICYCGKETRFINFNKGYKKYCSAKCAQNDPALKQKIINTNNKKYGVDHPCQNTEIKNKLLKTNNKKYGNASPMQNKMILEKSQNTCLNRYGVLRPIQNEEIKLKIKQTNLKRYGNVSTLHGINEEKIKQIKINKYGTYNNYNKIKQTMIKRYGVEHNSHHPEMFKKMQVAYGRTNTLKTINKSLHYQTKPELACISFCQSQNINIYDGPSIQYIFKNKKHIYHIDFETDKYLIEIKGNHGWYKANLASGKIEAKNKAAKKYAASINKEFLFLLEIKYYGEYIN